MLNGLHILLTYRCLYECDHCFLYCGPRAEGTFTLEGVRTAVDQAAEAGVEWLYLEGGEPFLFYPLLLESVRLGRSRGLRCGVVTNGYWAVSPEDAELSLAPLGRLGLEDLSISEDLFHSEDPPQSPARTAYEAACRLGIPAGRICLEAPRAAESQGRRGVPVVDGGVSLRGRAADKLAAGLPRAVAACFSECLDEDLARPSRVHLDPFGNVLACQGIIIGNNRRQSLREIMASYRPQEHPVIGPLLRGGPAEIARCSGLEEIGEAASACHLCYQVRSGLLERYPEFLGPPGVYGRS
jgi:hypothetical protein